MPLEITWASLPTLSAKDKNTTNLPWLTGIRTALQKLTALASTESSDGCADDEDDADDDDDDDDSCDSCGNWNEQEQQQQSLYCAEIQFMRTNSSFKLVCSIYKPVTLHRSRLYRLHGKPPSVSNKIKVLLFTP